MYFMLSVLAAAAAPSLMDGCRFISGQSREVIVFEDTDQNDNGDFVASLRLTPNEASKTIVPQFDKVRFKIRNYPKAPWRQGGLVSCRAGNLITVP